LLSTQKGQRVQTFLVTVFSGQLHLRIMKYVLCGISIRPSQKTLLKSIYLIKKLYTFRKSLQVKTSNFPKLLGLSQMAAQNKYSSVEGDPEKCAFTLIQSKQKMSQDDVRQCDDSDENLTAVLSGNCILE
jgi:hypothetical protein